MAITGGSRRLFSCVFCQPMERKHYLTGRLIHTCSNKTSICPPAPISPTGVSPHNSPRGIHVNFPQNNRSLLWKKWRTHTHTWACLQKWLHTRIGRMSPPQILYCTRMGHTCSAARVREPRQVVSSRLRHKSHNIVYVSR